MGCSCGSGGGGNVAYRVTYTDSDGEKQTEFVPDLGAFRMLRASVTSSGGAMGVATQVPRSQMDAWLAAKASTA